MKIFNAVGPHLPGVVIGLAKQKAVALSRLANLRPFRKTLVYTTDVTQDIYLIIIQLGVCPEGDRVIIVNGNEFRIISAVNEILGDGSIYPTVTWKGGTPPFIIKLVWRNPFDGGFYDEDVTARCVNINTNLTDGVGDIVTAAAAREYIVIKADDADDWWSDDLGEDDLGFSTEPDSPEYQQKRQNAIGILIEDSSTLPRQLFAPFSPDPTYQVEGDNTTPPTGLFAKYPEGRFGPPVWCLPIVHWDQPAAITYGTALQVGIQLAAYVHIPGTTTPLPGMFAYWLDGDHTVSAENTVPGADTGLPLYGTFQATDSLHYHLAEAIQGIVVNKANQDFVFYTRFSKIKSNELVQLQIMDYNRSYNYNPSPTAVSSNSSIISVTGAHSITHDDPTPAHSAWDVWNIELKGMTGGKADITVTLPGNQNYNEFSKTITLSAQFGINVPGGVSFDINDGPITYGEALDVLCWSPISGDPTYQTAGESAGWIVDPVPGTYLETNSDGTPHAYSITALFYPLDTVNYPSPMEYEQWLTVKQDTPVLRRFYNGSYTAADEFSVVYGTPWSAITNTVAFNSHNPDDPAKQRPVEASYSHSVSGHLQTEWNGPITDSSKIPGADTGFEITTQFFATGVLAHNYAEPLPAVAGIIITKKALTVTVVTATKSYDGIAFEPTVTYSGFITNDDELVLDGTLVFSPANITDVGAYMITPSGLTSDNYAIQFIAGWLTVNKASVSISLVSYSATYNGLQTLATAIVTPSQVATITYMTSTRGVLPNGMVAAGSYIVRVDVNTATHFSSAEFSFTINQGVVTFTETDGSITYGTALTQEYLLGLVTPSVPGTFSFYVNGVDTNGLVLNAAAYMVTYYFVPNDTTNYPSELSGSSWVGLTVNKANQATVSCAVNDYTLSVGQTATASGSGGSGSGAWTYQSSNPAIATVNSAGVVTAVASGPVSIAAHKAGDSNYNDSGWSGWSSSVVVEAPITVTISNDYFYNARITFGGGNGTYTWTQTGTITGLGFATGSNYVRAVSYESYRCYTYGASITITSGSASLVYQLSNWIPLIANLDTGVCGEGIVGMWRANTTALGIVNLWVPDDTSGVSVMTANHFPAGANFSYTFNNTTGKLYSAANPCHNDIGYDLTANPGRTSMVGTLGGVGAVTFNKL